MLKLGETTDVLRELADVLSEQQDPRAFVTVVFQTGAPPLLQQVPFTALRPDEFAQFVLDYCLQNRWNNDPSMLELLLTRLINSHGKAALMPLLTRVRAKIDPNQDMYAARWVLARQPFFARKDLRKCMQELVELNDRPVLLINGPDGSGRSYTKQFLEYIRDRAPNLRVVPAEIPPEAGPSYELETLADEFASQMGLDVPARTGSSYPSQLRRAIVRHVVRQPGKWLFVIERAGQKYLNEEVKDFVQEFAKAVTTGEPRRKMRLILIDYTEKIPIILPADVMDETIPPATSICSNDVVECLQSHNETQLPGRPTIQTAELPVIAADIINKAPAEGKKRLQYVYDELLAIARIPG